MSDEVQAAGGVIVRDGRVAVVHRPEHDDWSLPKGHVEAGESAEEAALREVAEETGLRCRALRPLEPVRYVNRQGRPKVVRYWLMEVASGEFAPNEEVDELRWLTPPEAADLLDYETDRSLVAGLAG